jgi:C-terminal processing protease CtpA/Prc
MDTAKYVSVQLTKPMGIVFEENDADVGGIFVQSLKEGGAAEVDGNLKGGDQLIIVGTKGVSGLDFDEALGTIIDAPEVEVKLTLFRGTAKQFYGPTGPSKEWLADFCAKGGGAL